MKKLKKPFEVEAENKAIEARAKARERTLSNGDEDKAKALKNILMIARRELRATKQRTETQTQEAWGHVIRLCNDGCIWVPLVAGDKRRTKKETAESKAYGRMVVEADLEESGE